MPALLLTFLTCCAPEQGAASPAPDAPSAAAPALPRGSLAAPRQREPAPSAPAAVPTVSGAAAGPGPAADPRSPGVVVNKRRPLSPINFEPARLVVPDVALGTAAASARLHPEAAAAVEKMFGAAAAQGIGLTLVSGYRSFADQEATYAHWVAQYGDPALADAVSARPGYSEHQTGLAFDIGQADGACTLQLCFRDTAAGRWAAANAAAYGIILRYPQGFHTVTGFYAESWHFRYVGTTTAAAMKAAGTATLEEHLRLPAAPSY